MAGSIRDELTGSPSLRCETRSFLPQAKGAKGAIERTTAASRGRQPAAPRHMATWQRTDVAFGCCNGFMGRSVRVRRFIGIDWADRKRDVCLQEPHTDEPEQSVLEHRPTAIDAWGQTPARALRRPPRRGLPELAYGPIVSALLEYDFFVIFPVNPSTLAEYRHAFTPSRAKDDPTDAPLALDLLRRHPERLKRLRRESADMRTLKRLVEARRDLVQDRVRITNRLSFTLKAYFPQVLDWFRDKEAGIFAAFLERWPSLAAARRARHETLVAFFHAHSVRRGAVIERRLDAIANERPLTTDAAVIERALLVVAALLPQLRALSAGIARLDAEIAARCEAYLTSASSRNCLARGPSSRRACSPPSASNASASQTPQRFRSTPALRLSPSAAATSTGCTGAGPARRSCARPSSNGSPALSHTPSGHANGTAPWIRVLFRCWVDRTSLRITGWHALRHTFCSHLAMRGAAAKSIQDLAGHQSTAIHYLHLAPGELRNAISLLEAGRQVGTKPKNEPKQLKAWGERRGLNPRPSDPQSDALPIELRPPYSVFRSYSMWTCVRRARQESNLRPAA